MKNYVKSTSSGDVPDLSTSPSNPISKSSSKSMVLPNTAQPVKHPKVQNSLLQHIEQITQQQYKGQPQDEEPDPILSETIPSVLSHIDIGPIPKQRSDDNILQNYENTDKDNTDKEETSTDKEENTNKEEKNTVKDKENIEKEKTESNIIQSKEITKEQAPTEISLKQSKTIISEESSSNTPPSKSQSPQDNILDSIQKKKKEHTTTKPPKKKKKKTKKKTKKQQTKKKKNKNHFLIHKSP